MSKIKSGFLIAIEGIDGSGKSSVAKALSEALTKENFEVILTREPGGTALGKAIRPLLQDKTVAISPKAEFFLFVADRAQHMQELVIPALQSGKIVISDRMIDSSRAYQGYGRGVDQEFINIVNYWAIDHKEPDLVIYIRIDHQTGIERIKKTRASLTSFEKETSEFFKRVIHGYEEIFKDRKNVIIIDGLEPLETVIDQAIKQTLEKISCYAKS